MTQKGVVVTNSRPKVIHGYFEVFTRGDVSGYLMVNAKCHTPTSHVNLYQALLLHFHLFVWAREVPCTRLWGYLNGYSDCEEGAVLLKQHWNSCLMITFIHALLTCRCAGQSKFWRPSTGSNSLRCGTCSMCSELASFPTPYPTFLCLQYRKVGYITSFEHDILGKWLNRPHHILNTTTHFKFCV